MNNPFSSTLTIWQYGAGLCGLLFIVALFTSILGEIIDKTVTKKFLFSWLFPLLACGFIIFVHIMGAMLGIQVR